jgi:predicted RNase H-like HicB family nuclease
MSDFYVAAIETNSEGEFFVTVPDLPGVNAAAANRLAALELAVEFANDYVRNLVEEGHAVPPARDLAEIEPDPEVREVGRALIPVRSLKISLSIDQALLTRADRAAAWVGLTRTGFFAAAVEEKIRESAPSSRERRLSPKS